MENLSINDFRPGDTVRFRKDVTIPAGASYESEYVVQKIESEFIYISVNEDTLGYYPWRFIKTELFSEFEANPIDCLLK